MNVREREMPPRPLIPWLAAFFAGLAGASALVLNAAADVLLGEGSWDIRTCWFLSVFAVTLAALGKACPWVARWKRGICRVGRCRCGRTGFCIVVRKCAARFARSRRTGGKLP